MHLPENLPELTPEERAAMEAMDLTPALGTPEERVKVAMNAAIRFMRERNQLRDENERLRAFVSECATDRDDRVSGGMKTRAAELLDGDK